MHIYKKVTAGDTKPKGYPASVYNGTLDLLAERGVIVVRDAPGHVSRQNSVVQIRNMTETDLDPFSVVSLDGSAFDFSDIEDETERNKAIQASYSADGVVSKAVLPDEKKATAITLESVPAGRIGSALVSGTTLCKVEMVSDSHKYAKPKEGETGYLVSSDTGPVRILYDCKGEAGKEDAIWASVMLGVEIPESGDRSIIYPEAVGRRILPFSIVKATYYNSTGCSCPIYEGVRSTASADGDDIRAFMTPSGGSDCDEIQYANSLQNFAFCGGNEGDWIGVTMEEGKPGEPVKTRRIDGWTSADFKYTPVYCRVYSKDALEKDDTITFVTMLLLEGQYNSATQSYARCPHVGAGFAIVTGALAYPGIVGKVVEKLEGNQWPPDEYLVRITGYHVHEFTDNTTAFNIYDASNIDNRYLPSPNQNSSYGVIGMRRLNSSTRDLNTDIPLLMQDTDGKRIMVLTYNFPTPRRQINPRTVANPIAIKSSRPSLNCLRSNMQTIRYEIGKGLHSPGDPLLSYRESENFIGPRGVSLGYGKMYDFFGSDNGTGFSYEPRAQEINTPSFNINNNYHWYLKYDSAYNEYKLIAVDHYFSNSYFGTSVFEIVARK